MGGFWMMNKDPSKVGGDAVPDHLKKQTNWVLLALQKKSTNITSFSFRILRPNNMYCPEFQLWKLNELYHRVELDKKANNYNSSRAKEFEKFWLQIFEETKGTERFGPMRPRNE